MGKSRAPFGGLAAGAAIEGDEADAQMRLAQHLIPPPRHLVHPARSCTKFGAAGFDHHIVIKLGRAPIFEVHLGQRISTLPAFDRRALIEEMAARRKKWKPRKTEYQSGTLWKYAQTVGDAHDGAVTHPGGKGESHVYMDQ